MAKPTIQGSELEKAAQMGMDEFLQVFIDATLEAAGGQLTAESMQQLTADQITLLAYSMLRDELMDGGFIQLIHNGLGSFIFQNPFDKALAGWGITELSRIIKKAKQLYFRYREQIEIECDDETFMAMFKEMPEFDDLDDLFVEKEEQFTTQVAYYVDENINNFANIKE